MRNSNFDKAIYEALQNQGTKQQLGNFLNTKEGKEMAMNLSKMANTNPNIQRTLNFASKGDINSAKNSLSSILNTKEGAELMTKLSGMMGGTNGRK